MLNIFQFCTSLNSVTIGSNVNTIGGHAFYKCTGLTSIIIPNGVTRIGSDAYSGCSGLVSILIGNAVNRISHLVFYDCKDLKDVYCLAEQVPIAEYDIFNNSNIESATLHVPESSIESYRAEKPWNKFKNIVVFDEQSSVQSITFDKNSNSPIYNINGRNMEKPCKGINIIGGKKFIMK